MSGIRIEGLTKTYRGGRVRALDGVSLEIGAGESFGIIGPNGAGKTTLVGCLLGHLRPDQGRIEIDGRSPDSVSVKRETGYLPERLVLDRWMTGRDFLEYHHALAGLDSATRRGDADAGLERVGLAAEAGGQPIRRYSRGMLQRLGLAQALLGHPRYLYLDEPISGVDPAGVILFRRLLQEVRAQGTTLIINSHQLDEVERVCDRVAFVQGGKVQSIETPQAGAEVSRVVAVRWTASTPAQVLSPDRFEAIAREAGARFADAQPPVARFVVADDDGAARLLERLMAAGVRISEAAPEGGRLERLFTAPEAPPRSPAVDSTAYAPSAAPAVAPAPGAGVNPYAPRPASGDPDGGPGGPR